jgi:hypothetical protein
MHDTQIIAAAIAIKNAIVADCTTADVWLETTTKQVIVASFYDGDYICGVSDFVDATERKTNLQGADIKEYLAKIDAAPEFFVELLRDMVGEFWDRKEAHDAARRRFVYDVNSEISASIY